MIASATMIPVTTLLAAWIFLAMPASPMCDGEPPALVNHDPRAYEFQIQCGVKTEAYQITAKATRHFDGKSGCTLKLGDNPPEKLFADMECVIEKGKLACELL